jgi:hypothetical protein
MVLWVNQLPKATFFHYQRTRSVGTCSPPQVCGGEPLTRSASALYMKETGVDFDGRADWGVSVFGEL